MGIFSFAKNVGEKIFQRDEPKPKKEAATPASEPAQKSEPSAQDIANLLLERIQQLGLQIDELKVSYDGDVDKATIEGIANSQADREKAILAVGNVQHVESVEDHIKVEADEPQSSMYAVVSGDTLSSIAKKEYGDANKYMKIFEANQPMLSDPNKIYPGQVLRIPA